MRVALPNGNYAYGRLLTSPYIAFYDLQTNNASMDLQAICQLPVLFVIAVHLSGLGRVGWDLIGNVPLEPALRKPVENFIQDSADFTNCRIIDDQGNVRAAHVSECVGLERAAVWEPEHVEERIMDHYAGRSNFWTERMKPNIS